MKTNPFVRQAALAALAAPLMRRAGLACAALLLPLGQPAPAAPGGQAPAGHAAAATARLKEAGQYDSLMQAVHAARYAVEAVPAASDPAARGGGYAGNPAHGLRCWFRADGLELQPGRTQATPWKLHLRLRGYGRGTLAAAAEAAVSAGQNRVELSWADGAVVEWYENKPAGLEQGFTVPHAPPGAGPLRLVLEAHGDLQPQLETGGDPGAAVRFLAPDGRAALRYSGLKVWDAARRELPAHLDVAGRQLTLVVNDLEAAYPVTIDPIFTSLEAKLTADDGAADNWFGVSVSLSEEGNTALVGAVWADMPA